MTNVICVAERTLVVQRANGPIYYNDYNDDHNDHDDHDYHYCPVPLPSLARPHASQRSADREHRGAALGAVHPQRQAPTLKCVSDLRRATPCVNTSNHAQSSHEGDDDA